MKKIYLIFMISLMSLSCSTEDLPSTKIARVNVVSFYNLPTTVSLNNIGLPVEFHHGEPFEVETGDIIKGSGRQITISINGNIVKNTQNYAEYVVE